MTPEPKLYHFDENPTVKELFLRFANVSDSVSHEDYMAAMMASMALEIETFYPPEEWQKICDMLGSLVLAGILANTKGAQ